MSSLLVCTCGETLAEDTRRCPKCEPLSTMGRFAIAFNAELERDRDPVDAAEAAAAISRSSVEA